MFKKLLAQLNDTHQDYREDLDEKLQGVIVSSMSPKPHQRASIGFIQKVRMRP